ncbi:hypothetical protein CCUS01_17420 [Colletotrichum cuscutae]|uniref:Uncharacterized protein n=1 Tax=Colletotrichum cuscutae TaxID=1209917 RepID=A0AAI9V8I8_9PEZI|nr:hypothetical protein CCUS01_17420 [Colletotrichum cuscutae]
MIPATLLLPDLAAYLTKPCLALQFTSFLSHCVKETNTASRPQTTVRMHQDPESLKIETLKTISLRSTLAESIDVPQASTWSTSSGLDMRRNSEPGSSSLDLANIPQVTSYNPSTHTVQSSLTKHRRPSLARPAGTTHTRAQVPAVISYTKTQANNVPGPHIEPLLPTTTSDRAAIAAGAGTQEPSLAFRARNNRWDAADTHRTEGNSQSATATQALAL